MFRISRVLALGLGTGVRLVPLQAVHPARVIGQAPVLASHLEGEVLGRYSASRRYTRSGMSGRNSTSLSGRFGDGLNCRYA